LGPNAASPQDAQSKLVAPNATLPTGTVDVSGGWMAGGAGGKNKFFKTKLFKQSNVKPLVSL